ncbi:hypothetical protein [Mucilaginibacter flavus]|uniref:hypothetical protein n=1 Tax=Mucilaginibacter flavus TaxID=931504 RepID=UPI0025B2CB32|nr:hypothetical protein [Mucilaginibacter flavus]MDN3580786.1 hypothetical protein [Mucilaginibacter flavus]
MPLFFIKYRKILFAASIYMFLYAFYEIYKGIEGAISVDKAYKAEGVGTFINACLSLFVAVYLFINVRKANKAVKNEHLSGGK